MTAFLFRPYLNCLDQFDQRLSEIILADYLKKPDLTAEYNFTIQAEDLLADAGGFGLPLDVDNLVYGGQKKNGFFIEAGAGGGKETLKKYCKMYIGYSSTQ